MTDRLLITTSIESTWSKNNEPVLFLGEWCKLYSRYDIWSEMDSCVVPYHWDDRKKLYKDFLHLENLYEHILQELSEKLNSIHGVNYSLRYWRILIGPWLISFIPILFDRFACLEKAISSYGISKTLVLDYSNLEPIPEDMEHFDLLMKTDQWNHFIYTNILKKIDSVKIINIEKTISHKMPKKLDDSNDKFSLRGLILKIASKLTNFFSGNSSVFIIDSYLRKFDLLKLQLRLFQFPALYYSPDWEKSKPDMKAREWKLSNSRNKSSFEEILRELIPLQIPVAYLEGYEKLNEKSTKVLWPKTPKLIWTTNAIFSEEVFKIWAANKSESGVPIILGQHGGVYGIGLFSVIVSHELNICDFFLSWGSSKWDSSKNSQKIIPIGIFKKYNKRQEKSSVLMITSDISRFPNNIVSFPMGGQWLYAAENEFRFVSLLPEYILKDFIVRPFINKYGWNQYQRWRDNFPKINIDSGEVRLQNLFLKSKISITTWNATTYLETLSLNIPTMMFWDPKFFEIKKSSEKYFDMLKQVGIFHETPESAANHLIKIWGDIDGWWESSEVIKAKEVFIQRYANNDDLLGKLTKVLKDPDNSMN